MWQNKSEDTYTTFEMKTTSTLLEQLFQLESRQLQNETHLTLDEGLDHFMKSLDKRGTQDGRQVGETQALSYP